MNDSLKELEKLVTKNTQKFSSYTVILNINANSELNDEKYFSCYEDLS